MIPHGVTPADDEMAAEIFGISVGTWRDSKRWEKIRGLKLLNRAGSRRRAYSKEQLLAAHTEQERAKALNVEPKYDLPPVPVGEHADDLLDLEESLLALPEDRRVTLLTWKGYRYGDKTRLPDPDFNLGGKKGEDGQIVGGEDFWRRQTILDWDANRPGRGSEPGRGRKPGSKDKQPRKVGAQAQERRERARRMLDEFPGTLTAKVLADSLDVHPVHAERLLREARLEKVRGLLADNPDLTVEDVQRETGLSVVAHARKLLTDAGGTTVAQ
ncbi:hypothetical protein P1P68_05945 [Streptomyces scabiei]|uniref:hypothetical protein n=1 Tax=Streptomyces scabiei TaxID=1930 RepID=UPI0029905713|nr:hypothetical protein [Streptomyces scabiei]MDW8804344.1 hypothetical protein [Streptomyces scabiei]